MPEPSSSQFHAAAAPPPPPPSGDSNHEPAAVMVPRRVIYLQGVLLCMVAVAAFLLGLLVRSYSPHPSNDGNSTGPVQASGIMLWRSDHQTQPLTGAIVMLVPVESARNEKLPASQLVGLLDGSVRLEHLQHQLRSWGGDVERCDSEGRVTVEVAGPGEFFCLVISPEGRRSPVQDRQTWAEIGRYLVNAYQELGNRRFLWQRCRIQPGIRLDYTLDGSG